MGAESREGGEAVARIKADRAWVVLLAVALAVRLATAWLLRQPGYTDAYYYATGARQLASGQGFDELFVWNYLDPPQDVTHPGYSYWMPLAAILGWAGTSVLGTSFRAMQIPFVLISALLPLVSYKIALDVDTGSTRSARADRRRYAMLAGLLALVPGFYTHVLVLPDSFAPFALAGSVCLWAAGRGMRDGRARWFAVAGLAAGVGHLSRADGLLLLGVALVAAAAPPPAEQKWSSRLVAFGACLLGYLAVMSPWLVRNWLVLGSPLPGAGLQTLFLTTYDDMFAYGRTPTLGSYLAWGWDEIVRSKLLALGQNAIRMWVENFLIVLLPLSARGLWRLRGDRLLWPFLLYLPLLFASMTLAFTFAGMRGGLYHSGGALLPFIFAASGPGLAVAVRWGARRFAGWNTRQAWLMFAASLVGMALIITVFALWRAGVMDGEWKRRDEHYDAAGQWLAARGEENPIVMVGDAPAFAWHTGLRAVAIPNEPLDTVVAVADKYQASYLLLDDTRPRTTDSLYSGEEGDPRFELVHKTDSARLYAIRPLPGTSHWRDLPTGSSPANRMRSGDRLRRAGSGSLGQFPWWPGLSSSAQAAPVSVAKARRRHCLCPSGSNGTFERIERETRTG